ncbi:helix-turn-helix transcriptional regulator [Streptomyces stelliscabiei]|uniref:helix-turn-helix domain-containing protein n=1 Tax=Streptomyces stelliscabiei TaxID=146820 RepID=UPI0029AED197|nr:helix-turn-helix transcriptional regulator [Streptomyces stelliscabiei]MDX2515458.1 helix-turn-helix transcriptional regulator [Streptomyces stelliscabiei]
MTEQQYGRRAIETGPTGKTVAENLTKFRKIRGYSTRQLSAALDRVGRSVSPSGISRMEKADRHVTADELMALAAVLNVSPSALLLPLEDSPDKTVEITGVGTTPADVAWDWLDGNRPLRISGQDIGAARLEHELYSRPAGRRGRLPQRGAKDVADVIEWLRDAGAPVDEALKAAGVLPTEPEDD